MFFSKVMMGEPHTIMGELMIEKCTKCFSVHFIIYLNRISYKCLYNRIMCGFFLGVVGNHGTTCCWQRAHCADDDDVTPVAHSNRRPYNCGRIAAILAR